MNALETIKVRIAADPFDRPDSKAICLSMGKKLRVIAPHVAPLPDYQMEPWSWSQIPAMSALLRVSFRDTRYLDLYPQLASRTGCTELVHDLISLPEFLPGSSWLISRKEEPAGMILCSRAPGWVFGQIHVVAVSPRHRNKGLGSLLVNKSLENFMDYKLQYALLNVCRSNKTAIRFFRRLGFIVNTEGDY